MTQKSKILLLHGYGEDAELFKIKTRNLRRVIGDNAELVYLTAPINVGMLRATAEELLEPQEVEFPNYAWWWVKDTKFVDVRGMEESLKYIGKVLNEQGPFDGIVGFSQGASISTIVCALLEGREGVDFGIDVDHPPFKFAIFCGNYVLDISRTKSVFGEKIKTPSFHTMGTLDTVVAIEKSQKALENFVEPIAFEFVGGHFMPNTTDAADAMRDFLLPYLPLE